MCFLKKPEGVFGQKSSDPVTKNDVDQQNESQSQKVEMEQSKMAATNSQRRIKAATKHN